MAVPPLPHQRAAVADDEGSQITYRKFIICLLLTLTCIFIESGASNASKASYMSRKSEMMRKEAAKKEKEWDASTCAGKDNAEDRIAAKIASEVLKDNAKLRAVHSGQSIK